MIEGLKKARKKMQWRELSRASVGSAQPPPYLWVHCEIGAALLISYMMSD